jgi:hypothetical protein
MSVSFLKTSTKTAQGGGLSAYVVSVESKVRKEMAKTADEGKLSEACGWPRGNWNALLRNAVRMMITARRQYYYI